MARAALCTEAEIKTLVFGFYDKIRADAILGPVFDAHIKDWDAHLAIMVSFWSSILLGTGTFSGTPMPKHIALPDLQASMFQHWLALFEQTTATLANRAFAERANILAHRVARSLWYGYQLNNHPDRVPTEITA